MALEWLRRRDPALDANLRKFLFTSGPITEIGDEGADGAGGGPNGRRVGVARHREPQGGRAMNHLHRELAPISEDGWEVIDEEATSRLPTYLAARKLVDFAGPHGWSHSATNLGRIATIAGPSEGVAAAQRRVLPLVELRAEFSVSRVQLDDVERGAADPDLPELDEAVRQIALGRERDRLPRPPGRRTRGITESTSHEPIALDGDVEKSPDGVARARRRPAPGRHRRPVRVGHLPGHLHEDRRDHRVRRASALRPSA